MPENYSYGQDPSAPKSKSTEFEAIISHLERVLNTAVELRDRTQKLNMRLTPAGCMESADSPEKPSRTGLIGNCHDLLDEIDRIQKMQASELSLLSNTL